MLFIESARINEKEKFVQKFMNEHVNQLDPKINTRGLGLIWGIDLTDIGNPAEVVAECFERGLIIESAGRKGQVIKLLPALNIPMDLLEKGCSILGDAVQKTVMQSNTVTV